MSSGINYQNKTHKYYYFLLVKMPTLKSIESEINSIKERNKRVEADKAWEVSFTRKIIIAVLTYSLISLFFFVMGFPKPLINAIVPTLAFFFSTMTLSFFKNVWKKHIYKK
jgi:hypothetical protein